MVLNGPFGAGAFIVLWPADGGTGFEAIAVGVLWAVAVFFATRRAK